MAARSARDVGRRLLGEVEEVDLSELLQDLNAPLPGTTTGTFNVPILDALVTASQPPQVKDPSSTGVEQATTASTIAEPRNPRRRPLVLELASASPACGKTHLIYLAIAAAVLPVRANSTTADIDGFEPRTKSGNAAQKHQMVTGKGGCAVVIDTEQKFDVLRLASVMRATLIRQAEIDKQTREQDRRTRSRDEDTGSHDDRAPVDTSAANSSANQAIEATISHALRHVHVFQPLTLASLSATLTHLPEYLLDTSTSTSRNTSSPHPSADRAVALISLSDPAGLLPPARLADDLARLDASSDADAEAHAALGNRTAGAHGLAGYASLASALRRAQSVLCAPVLVGTTDGLARGQSTSSGPAPRHPATGHGLVPGSLLPAAWRDVVGVRAGVARRTARRFAAGASVAECERDRGMREEAVRGMGMWVWVDGARQNGGEWGCVFSVGEDGGVEML